MKSGAAKTIIDEFELIGGYDVRRHEMLNSGTVLDIIDKDKRLAADPSFKRYISHIKKNMKIN